VSTTSTAQADSRTRQDRRGLLTAEQLSLAAGIHNGNHGQHETLIVADRFAASHLLEEFYQFLAPTGFLRTTFTSLMPS